MPTLSVKNFSCIDEATFELAPVTIFIGPQASGKSVLTKLFYFFASIFNEQYPSAEDGDSIRVFKKRICQKFYEWFPPTAWGKKPFQIDYIAGPFRCRISRKENNRRILDEIELNFSDFFESQYSKLVMSYRRFQKHKLSDDEFDPQSLDQSWKVRQDSSRMLSSILKNEFINYQLFIPAGRSFFANLGKAIAMLEHGSQLDDLTKSFGRIFTSLLDNKGFYFFGDKPNPKVKEFINYQKKEISSVFGGEIKLSKNDTHVSTKDGRKIPFSALSSGQQELLPLLLIIQHFTKVQASKTNKATDVIYIEEPEAHLFPTAQGELTAHLAAVSNFISPYGHLFITTHSPYVLSKLNTLIKAFSTAATNENRQTVSDIVPEQLWLAPGRVSAYALQDGLLRSIKDASGLLDGEYLDQISDEISADFMALLEIEANASR
jgi:hypothetical protein